MKFFDSIRNARVLVVGDVMLDRYWWGDVTRISPEAPVPVVRLKKTTVTPGGAANVAANIAGLGAKPYLIGCVGRDGEAADLQSYLQSHGITTDHLVDSGSRSTSVKTRIVAHSQHVVRIDNEVITPIGHEDQRRILEKTKKLLSEVDTIAISDYAKGVLTDEVLVGILEAAESAGVPVLVDPKGRNYSKYRGALMLTPNRNEAAEACNLDPNTPDLVSAAGGRLMDELNLKAILITQGEQGMTLFETNEAPVSFRPEVREVYDVTGAGDTVIACMAAALSVGGSFKEAAQLANLAAGLVVEQVGTTAIKEDLLREALNGNRDEVAKPRLPGAAL